MYVCTCVCIAIVVLTATAKKSDGYFNLYVMLSELHHSTPGTAKCAECVWYLLSNEAIEQLRKRVFTSSLSMT